MQWRNFVLVCQHNLISVAIRITPVSTGNCKETIFPLNYKFLMATSSLTTQTLPVNTSVNLAAKFLTSGVTKFYKNFFGLFCSHKRKTRIDSKYLFLRRIRMKD